MHFRRPWFWKLDLVLPQAFLLLSVRSRSSLRFTMHHCGSSTLLFRCDSSSLQLLAWLGQWVSQWIISAWVKFHKAHHSYKSSCRSWVDHLQSRGFWDFEFHLQDDFLGQPDASGAALSDENHIDLSLVILKRSPVTFCLLFLSRYLQKVLCHLSYLCHHLFFVFYLLYLLHFPRFSQYVSCHLLYFTFNFSCFLVTLKRFPVTFYLLSFSFLFFLSPSSKGILSPLIFYISLVTLKRSPVPFIFYLFSFSHHPQKVPCNHLSFKFLIFPSLSSKGPLSPFIVPSLPSKGPLSPCNQADHSQLDCSQWRQSKVSCFWKVDAMLCLNL